MMELVMDHHVVSGDKGVPEIHPGGPPLRNASRPQRRVLRTISYVARMMIWITIMEQVPSKGVILVYVWERCHVSTEAPEGPLSQRRVLRTTMTVEIAADFWDYHFIYGNVSQMVTGRAFGRGDDV